VLANAQAAADAYVANARLIGRDINRASIFAAIGVAGVSNVALSSPAATCRWTPPIAATAPLT
jgi:phage-related baseplate assembly protein